ncbi:MAG: YfhO family protein [Eubacterium sp.]|nr:YfhO family protein [Eubacterium sp.]
MKTTSDSMAATKKARRLICILAFAIPFIAVLIGLIAGSFAPFGDKDVMTAGGMEDHLTRFYEFYDYVHGEESVAAGEDITTVFTYYVSDPLNLVALIFPRSAVPAVLDFLYALKIGLAGLFMSFFLTRHKERSLARKVEKEALRAEELAVLAEKQRKKEEARKLKTKGQKDFRLGGSEEPKSKVGRFLQILDLPVLGFSLAFALSAWMFGQGMDVSHLSVVALFPLIILALDSLLEDGKWRLYAALMTASVFCNFYMTGIVFIFTILYFAVHSHKSTAQALRSLVLKLIADILAAGAGMLIILNSVSSSFFHNEISLSFPKGAVSTSFFDIIKAMMPNTAPSNTLYFGYGLDIYCGLFALFLVVIYLFNPNISLRRKLSQTGLLLALGSGLILVTPNYLFNGFFASRENMCVFGFLFVFQLISIAYEAFLNLEHISLPCVHVGGILLFAVIILSVFFCDGYDQMKPFYVGLELLLVYYILMCMYRSNNMTKWLFGVLVALLLSGEMVYTYINSLRLSGNFSATYEETFAGRVYETKRELRKEKPDAKILVYGETDSEPVTNALLGYDYVLAFEGTDPVDSLLEKVETKNGLDIYRNPYAVKGFFMPKEAASFNYDSQYPFTALSSFAEDLTGVKGVYTRSEGSFSLNVSPVFDIKAREDVRRGLYTYSYATEAVGDLYGHINETVHLGEKRNSGSVSYDRELLLREKVDPRAPYEFAVFDANAYRVFCDNLIKADLVRDSLTYYSVIVNVPTDGYMVVPLPSRIGWSAEGTLLSQINIGEDLLVLAVSAGENQLSLQYSPVQFFLGIAISILCLIVMALLAMKDKISLSQRTMQGPADFIRDKYVYFLTAGLTLLSLLIMMCYTSSMPFGTNSLLIGDGYYQAYNGYRGLVHDVQSGNFSLLNWNMGVAIDRYSEFAGYFLSPWSLLKLLVMPDSMIYTDLIFSRILSFVTPGLYLILYLTHRRRGGVMDKRDWRLIPVGVAYSLSSYAIAYFVYSGFGFLRIIPLILLGMERLIYDRKPFLYIFFLFSFMGDAYYAFMLCEFIFLYFFTMEFTSIKDMFFKGIRILIASVAAAGLACYRLIPYFFRTQVSPYKVDDVISPVTKENGSYLSVFSETMSFRQPSVVTTNDYEANLYLGILVLICIPLYLMNKRVPLSVRIRRMLLVILLFIGFGNGVLNFVFHGFHYQSMVPNRFAAFYVILLIIMFYDCLLSWRDYRGKTFAISIGGSVGICILLWSFAYASDANLKRSVLNSEEASISFILTVMIASTYLILALLQLWKKHRTAFRSIMVALLLVEVFLSSFCTFKKAIGGEAVAFSRGTDQIDVLSERNPKMHADFHATEYVADPAYNTAEAGNITSVSAFSSTLSDSHIQMIKRWSSAVSTNMLFYYQGNALEDMMLHINYHVTNDAVEGSISPYPEIDHQGTVRLHENPWYLPVGVFFSVTEEITDWDRKDYSDYDGNVLACHNAFAHAFSCEDIYHEIIMTEDSSLTDNYSNLNLIHVEKSDNEEETAAYIHLAEDLEGDIYTFYQGTVNYLGKKSGGKETLLMFYPHFSESDDNTKIRIAVLDKEEMQKLHDILAKNTMEDATIKGASFSGTINAPENGMVYLSIPHMTEWSFEVDGQKVESRGFLGGTGIPVTAGEHYISVRFVPHGMWTGILISLTTLIVVILYAVFRNRHLKRVGVDENVDKMDD